MAMYYKAYVLSTGETSLHLAARYARADAAKTLLDASADPNTQDSTGRTPLHTAVAADAQGVFQVESSNFTAYTRSLFLWITVTTLWFTVKLK